MPFPLPAQPPSKASSSFPAPSGPPQTPRRHYHVVYLLFRGAVTSPSSPVCSSSLSPKVPNNLSPFSPLASLELSIDRCTHCLGDPLAPPGDHVSLDFCLSFPCHPRGPLYCPGYPSQMTLTLPILYCLKRFVSITRVLCLSATSLLLVGRLTGCTERGTDPVFLNTHQCRPITLFPPSRQHSGSPSIPFHNRRPRTLVNESRCLSPLSHSATHHCTFLTPPFEF